MIYDEDTVVDALGIVPISRDELVKVYEAASEGSTLRVLFQIYDDEVTLEWLLPSGRCATRLRLQELRGLRSVQDPQSKFLEVTTDNMTVEIWFDSEPRLYILPSTGPPPRGSQ